MKTDPRIDEMIAKAPAFARPILTHLRRLVHAGCPDVEEAVKWGRATFVYRGRLLCGMASFKAHCGFGFWHAEMSALVTRELGEDKAEGSSGQFGRLTRLEDLPDDATMRRCLAEAVRLNESGQPVRPPRATTPRKPAAEVPADLAALLEKNAKAKAAFEGFSPSHRREYIEWITGAKRDETRQKRLATTLEWLADGQAAGIEKSAEESRFRSGVAAPGQDGAALRAASTLATRKGASIVRIRPTGKTDPSGQPTFRTPS